MEEIGGRASLVCVTKLHEVPEIEELLACGARIVGENRVEEVERKFGDGMLKKRYPGLEMHLIGHLQSRKAKKAVELCDCIACSSRVGKLSKIESDRATMISIAASTRRDALSIRAFTSPIAISTAAGTS